MKKFLSIISLFLVCLQINASGQTTYPSGMPNCVARWNFASGFGTITSLPDVSGNGNNGTAANLTAVAGFRGIFNSAMSFNGHSSFSDVANSATLNPTSITIVSVVNFKSWNSATCQINQIISHGEPYGVSGNWGLGAGDNTFDNSCTVFSPNNTQIGAQMGTATWTLTPGNYIDSTKWYFVAASYDGNTLKLYQVPMSAGLHVSNVSPITTITGVGTAIGTNTDSISIGKHLNPSYPYWVNGSMDELAVFNTALTDSEVQGVYDYLWGIISVSPSFTDTLICSGTTFSLPYTVNDTEVFYAPPYNTFTAQLSNASGSFASGTANIGTYVSNKSGTINCIIPANTPTGTGYRIRIISNAAVDTSLNFTPNIHIINLPAPVGTSNSPVCVGSTLNLSATSPDSASVSWSWTGPNGFYSPLQRPSITALATDGGNYVVSTSVSGCTTADTIGVAILTAPVITGSPVASTICAGSNTSFGASATGSNVGYQWQVNTGSGFSNVSGAVYTNGTTGTLNITGALASMNGYVYQCVVSNVCGSATSGTAILHVNTPTAPTISNQSGNSTVCAGSNASFNLTAAGGGGSLSYQWQVNTGSGFSNVSGPVYSGATSNTLNITGVSASMNGYIYQNVVTGLCGATITSNADTLHINTAPVISASGQPVAAASCPGNNASFSVTATGSGLQYQWYKNGSLLANGAPYTGATTATLNITNATLAMNGLQFSCVVSGSCLPNVTSSSATLTVTVFSATVTATGATTICSGGTTQLNANTIPSASYQWQLNGVDISGAINQTYNAGSTGNYSVIISSASGCYASSSSVYLDVIASPAIPVITSTAPDTICAGTPLTLQATPVPGLLYQWALDGINIPNAVSINYLVPLSGSGVYTVTVTSSNNCTETSAPVNVVVNTPPAPFTITDAGSGLICLGSSVTLTGDVPAGFSYQWYDNNNKIIGALNSSYNAPDSGNYTLVITDGNGCSTTSIPFHLLLDIVSPVIQPYGDMLCTNTYAGYQWYLNGNMIPGATSTCYTPVQSGHYSVWATDEYGCGGMSNYIDEENLAVNTVNSSGLLKIYPNPATSVIHIDAPVKVNVTISGMEGKLISSYTEAKDIDISQLANGIYMIRVYDENQSLLHTEKLVKTSW